MVLSPALFLSVFALTASTPGSGEPAPGAQPASALAQKPLRIAMPATKAQGELPPRLTAALEQALVAEIRKLDRTSAITASELSDLLSMERQKVLLGCEEDEACLSLIAGAIDADELVTLEIAQVGGRYTLGAKRFDARAFELRQAYTQTVERREGEELLALIGPAVKALYPERALREGRERGVDVAFARRVNPPPLPRWVFFSTAAAAGVTAVGGAAFTLMHGQEQRALDQRLEASTRGEAISALEVRSRLERSEERARAANVLFGVAGAFTVLTAVEAFFTDWNDDRAALRMALVPGAEGATWALGGSF